MGKINVLSPEIFNRIAAGEVVDRPYSVIKELLDNSIDAGSTKIEIEIIEGGIKTIKVVDNGCGILKEDLDKLFLPHSTSKIASIDDLDKISTLGFRGEALASISSVCQVTVYSKTESEETGYTISCNGGEITKPVEFACNNGTTFEVNNIFFNVPARAKFLKKPKQEASEITNLISRYILANPTISFKYTLDGKEIYFSTGEGLEEALYVVYGADCVKNLVKVDYKNNDGYKIWGYIGKPTYSKPNRTYQTLIVNSRYVINSMVSTCIYNSFEHYLMKGQFPFYVLNLCIPLDKLDVNVHPNKMDIKFENNNYIYGIVYNAIADSLLSSNSIYKTTVSTINIQKVEDGISFSKPIESKPENVQINNEKTEPAEYFSPVKQVNLNQETKATDFYSNLTLKDTTNLFSKPIVNSSFNTISFQEEIKEENKEENIIAKQTTIEEVDNYVNFIGEIYLTYLIIEANNTCYIIDQHAAHERLLFDKLMAEINAKEVKSQLLLFPYILNVNNQEFSFLIENIDNLKKLGFDIEEFGNNAFKISATPNVLYNINLENFFDSILKDISIFKSIKSADMIIDKVMQKACKAAIKAGKRLTENEVLTILKLMKEQQMVLECPHGRPVIVELTKKELEKWFKRTI